MSVRYKMVDGVRAECSPEETADILAIEAQEPRRAVLMEIARLEAGITPRRLREALLTDEGKTWLAAREAEIAAERGKL